jgi:hypothetical protein
MAHRLVFVAQTFSMTVPKAAFRALNGITLDPILIFVVFF